MFRFLLFLVIDSSGRRLGTRRLRCTVNIGPCEDKEKYHWNREN